MNHLESSFTGKNAFWRYLLMLVAIFIATNTIGGIPLLIAMVVRGADNPEIITQLAEDPNNLNILGLDSNLYLFTMIFPFLIGLITFILLIKPLNQKSLMCVINGTDSFRWNRFFISALVWLIISALYLSIYIKLDPLNFKVNNRSIITLAPLIMMSVLFIPFQAAFEEVLCRGYLMQGFAVLARNRWIPLVMTSVIFGLMHFLNPEVSEFGFGTMMPQYVLFGLIFGIMTIMDDGVEAAIGAHAANNVFLCIMVTHESSALQTPALYQQIEINPWIDFISMLFMGMLVIFILGIIFKWKGIPVYLK